MSTKITFLMKKDKHFPKKKKNGGEEWHCFAILQLPLMSDFIGETWILISASPFNLFCVLFWTM